MNLKERLDDLIARGHTMTKMIAQAQFGDDSPEARTITRRWGITEAAELIGVTPQTIRNAEESGKLPPADTVVRGRVPQRAGYTIGQINDMRDHFGTRPSRPDGQSPAVLAIAAHKGGAFKTSTSVHMAQWAALQGLRVLLIDATDPQATASLYHGYVPDLHIHAEDTLLPYYLGERDNAEYAIKPTCWPNLDIIPSCLAIHRIESEIEVLEAAGKLPVPSHLLLRAAIESVWDSYDLIVIDSAPNLGIGTINVVCAADVIVVPTPAELYDYVSSLQFFTMLRDLIANVDLGGFEPDVRVLVTKYSSAVGNQSAWMDEQIRNAWGGMVLKEVVRLTDEVGKGQVRMRTVFEQAANQRSTPTAWRNAVAIWEPVCREIYERLIKTRWENNK
ncbi:plasmid-partitioning protein SopA [Salmonella enterica subsp. enterica serovar Typhimurium]|uniref:Plasmid-partitioning protein SopA n=1 Tax=Salmonella enterica TaxID=28901 RepID=A0A7U7L9M7_SALER|nr:plasmid-partitioning protein SopA [Salmonella enterica]EDC8734016.1 plasmid-partitioning protein SopA [Salmonella enterica subsp. enterica serovar Typhimurium]EDR1391515.1 plasmid-partitioning protein SopA [Salmonella enterica subsp. enterica serovar Thompson]EAA8668763.1 plasmid-partitioning protein SopA [Salmonella enterica]EAB1623466.1 plasmid-partitioning protein SopA [Salmonella enterica]EAP3640159.1 plasmid-partitioning protein SopA [Salmonella enterica]